MLRIPDSIPMLPTQLSGLVAKCCKPCYYCMGDKDIGMELVAQVSVTWLSLIWLASGCIGP